MPCRKILLSSLVLLLLSASLIAQQPPSYVKQVKPFLAKYCVECHNPDKDRGELDVTTLKAMHRGGQNGPSIVPGKPDESLLVRLTEGKDNPRMPPRNAKNQPTPTESAVLRAWVLAGARDDSGSVAITLPPLAPREMKPSPVTALAFRPNGRPLAAGGHKEAVLIDPATGEVTGKLHGQAGKVTALAFSSDGEALAVASGQPGSLGEIRLYFVPPSGLPTGKPELTIEAHKDVVLGLAFSPDGRTLATCGYDRLIKLWDTTSGREIRTLKDHSDSVYSVSFSPDGKWLASGGADRAVKVWDITSGKRLYTLGESTDWVYAVAWHPQGKHLAAAGVDRSIRVWQTTATGGQVVHSVFAHEGPVSHLAYSVKGETLYSLSEDRTIKAWVTGTMRELRVYARQPDAALALAVRPDGKQLAIGRYDGTLVLMDEATGSTHAEPLPVRPKPPVLKKIGAGPVLRGQPTRITFEGDHLDGVTHVTSFVPNFRATLVAGSVTANKVVAEVTFPETAPPGIHTLGLESPAGATAKLGVTLDLFSVVQESEPNDSPATGQKVTLPISLVGGIGRSGETDYYRFEARAGQEVGVQILTTAVGSKLDAVLVLTDASGLVVAEGRDNALGYRCTAAGTYALGIRDREYRGGTDMTYRLHLGQIPVVTSVFPLGLRRGTERDIAIEGVHLKGQIKGVTMKAKPDAAPGSRLPLDTSAFPGTLGAPSLVVGEFPEVRRGEVLPVPGTANGRLDTPDRTETWRFSARKGQKLLVEIHARRLGSPLDSVVEILDAAGQPVPRATLRCVAKTYTTFRDHDAAGSGIRIEHWTELAMRDYLLAGSELLRIRELPKNPDDDCQFVSAGGQRLGMLDTTPTHHPLGEPMYKVTIHPPGTTFPPNGFPVVTVPYRNDDGGPGYGKDSRLFFDAPADGEYQVRVRDARGHGGITFAYRLTVRTPQPSFNVSFTPTAPQVSKGSAVPLSVNVERLDGFDGQVDVRLENVPAGFSAPATNILSTDNSTALAFFADMTAVNPPAKAPPLKLVARAVIDDKVVMREAAGGLPKVLEAGDIVTTTEQSEVTLRPGGETQVTVRVERRNGFEGRIPVEVRGLPYGVRVLNIGLNGILITERETVRTMVLYAEPWVEPTTHPIVVLAKREGKGTDHAARSLLLKVAPQKLTQE